MARMNDSGNATVSASVPSPILEEFDEWVEKSDYESRSEALREVMRDASGGSAHFETPLRPPTEEDLEWAYRRLCQVASQHGVVRGDTAKRVCSGGRPGYSKEEAQALLIHKLHRRNYIRQISDSQGRNTAWKLVGWSE